MGHDPRGRRHATPAWLSLITAEAPVVRGRKLVVQMVKTHRKGEPAFVETLDAIEVGRRSGMPIAPIMIYGDDVTHVVSEMGIAYLYQATGHEERRAALAAIAGDTPIGRAADPARTRALRARGVVALPEDLGVRRADATRALLAAQSLEELTRWSGGLYVPPASLSGGK